MGGISFEVWQDDTCVASADGPLESAMREALHYAAVYGQDGPVTVLKVERTPVQVTAPVDGRRMAETEGLGAKPDQRGDAEGGRRPTSSAQGEVQKLVERLRELLAKATKRPWTAFDRNNVLAIMKGRKPARKANGYHEKRWPEIVAWPGFDSADTPKQKRRADLHLIVEAVNALPTLLDHLSRPSLSEAPDEDTLIVLMLNELHAHLPEDVRPMAMCDLSDEQAARARNAVRKVVSSLPSRDEIRAKTETAWLVEREDASGLHYAMAHGWTRDHLEAMRFAREVDALAFAKANRAPSQDCISCGWCNYTRVVEHRWG